MTKVTVGFVLKIIFRRLWWAVLLVFVVFFLLGYWSGK